MDARDTDGVAAAFADAEAAVGPLNGVVYAAGVAFVTPFLDIDDDEWNLVNDVTLSGTQRVLATFARLRVDRNEPGAFVAISSVDAQRPVAGLAHYCAAKAGVESLVRVAALELATHQIRVNAVAPGATMTPPIEAMLARAPAIREDFLEHIPMGRIACPSEIASVVEFLLSDAARYVTGQTVIVDGGMTLREHARLLDPVAETS